MHILSAGAADATWEPERRRAVRAACLRAARALSAQEQKSPPDAAALKAITTTPDAPSARPFVASVGRDTVKSSKASAAQKHVLCLPLRGGNHAHSSWRCRGHRNYHAVYLHMYNTLRETRKLWEVELLGQDDRCTPRRDNPKRVGFSCRVVGPSCFRY